jgi:hypothetical protein
MIALRLAPALLALLLAAPALAGTEASYVQPDGTRLIIEIDDNGDARIGEVDGAEYGLLLKDGFYMVGREQGKWRTARLTDVAAAIDQAVRPIFGDVLSPGSTRRPPPGFRIEARGERDHNGGKVKVYAVHRMSGTQPQEPEIFLMSDNPELRPVGRVLEQFMNAAIVPSGVLLGPAAADIIAETRAIFALGTPIDAGGRFKLDSLHPAMTPLAPMPLPAPPASTAELVAMMKASMKTPE